MMIFKEIDGKFAAVAFSDTSVHVFTHVVINPIQAKWKKTNQNHGPIDGTAMKYGRFNNHVPPDMEI